MFVKDVMTTRVKTVTPATTIRDVAVLMCFYHISGLPVVDDQGNIRGLISEKDVLGAMYPKVADAMQMGQMPRFEELEHEYRDVLGETTETYMSKHVYTVAPDDPILRAVAVMFAHRIRRIPVASAGKLVGILSIGDVHKAVLRKTFDAEVAENASHLAAGS